MTDSANGGRTYQTTNPALRNRKLAGVLALVYAALLALAGYLESICIAGYLPLWVFIAAGLTWFAIMMVLPFLIVQYFFGLDLSILWRTLRRFSLRKMLLWTFWISLFIWYFTQTQWLDNRRDWRRDNPTAVRTTKGK